MQNDVITGSAWSKPSLKKAIRRRNRPSTARLFRRKRLTIVGYIRLCGHALANEGYILPHELDNPVVVLRILVARSSRLQHFECFEAQLNGFQSFVLYPCGQHQRVGLEIVCLLYTSQPEQLQR